MRIETEQLIAERTTLPADLQGRIDAAAEEQRKIAEAQATAVENARANFESNPTEKLSERLAIATLSAQNLTSRAERIIVELEKEAESYKRAALLQVLDELRSGVTREAINAETEPRAQRDAKLRHEILKGLIDDEKWKMELYQRRGDVEGLSAELGMHAGNIESLEQISGLDARLARVGNVMFRELVGNYWSSPLIGRLIRETERE